MQLEVLLECAQKVRKEELLVDIALNTFGKFVHEALVNITLDSVVLVMLPIVLKVLFKLFGHVLRQGFILVEMS